MPSTLQTSDPAPRIGNRVLFSWGRHQIEGCIVEDRGNIGVGGRRLYRIEADLEPGNHITIELPRDMFQTQN